MDFTSAGIKSFFQSIAPKLNANPAEPVAPRIEINFVPIFLSFIALGLVVVLIGHIIDD
jgi:capsular polysaccharide biosynthesis protein